MHIAQIVKIRLKGAACDHLTHSAYVRVDEWLKQWSAPSNFKAVIAPDRPAAIERCRVQLRNADAWIPSHLQRMGVHPNHFFFNVSDQAVVDDSFWMSSSVICGTDHATGDIGKIKE